MQEIYNIATIIAVVVLLVQTIRNHRRIRRLGDRPQIVNTSSVTPIEDRLSDHDLLVRMLNAKKVYCMDYNAENHLYCTHYKNHKTFNHWLGKEIKHKTHQNGEIRWAMKKKV